MKNTFSRNEWGPKDVKQDPAGAILVGLTRRKIMDEALRDSTVTLIGKETWKRKNADWQFASSIRQTKFDSRLIRLCIFSRNIQTSVEINTIPTFSHKDFILIQNVAIHPSMIGQAGVK